MTNDARLFVGLELNDEVRSALGAFRRELAQSALGKLPHPSLYHLTLCFLGQTPRGRIPALCDALDRVPKRPLRLSLGALGTFKNGSVLWIGIEEPHPGLRALQTALSDALGAAGFCVERGGYVPHITLGRQVRLLGELPDPPHAAFPVSHVTLFESTRVDGRLAYLPLYRSGMNR